MTTVSVYLPTPAEGHPLVVGMWTGVIRPDLQAPGRGGFLTYESHSTVLRKKMRGAFHGYILDAFSNQVWFVDAANGLRFRYAKEVWKEYLKQQFLPPKMEERRIKSTGEIKIVKRRPSTEDLSDDEYSLFLTKVEAYGIVDLGIEFPEEDY